MILKPNWARLKTFGMTALLAGLLTVSLAACGGDGGNTGTTGNNSSSSSSTNTTGGDQPPATTQAKVNSVDVELNEWNVLPKDLKIPAGSTKFTAKNTG